MTEIEKTNQQLKELSGLTHLRLRPGMYVGSVANAYHLYREIRDNASDDIINGFATDVWVTLHEDGSLSVRDNGRGLPIQPMQMIDGSFIPSARAAVSRLNVSSHYELDNSASAGTNGVGSKAVTALSDFVDLKIWRDNKYYSDHFIFDELKQEPGIPTVELKSDGTYYAQPQSVENLPEGEKVGYHGTEFTFKPSEEVFESIDFDFDLLKSDLHRLAYLNASATYHLSDETSEQKITLHEEGGLKAYVQFLSENSEGQLITSIHEFEGTVTTESKIPNAPATTIQAKIALAWTTASEMTAIGFTNTLFNSQGGTHIDGFLQGISRLFNNYNKNLNLSKDTIEARDLRPGLIAVISLLHTDPVYSSQTKDMMTETSAKSALNKITYEQGQFEWDKYISEVEAVIKQSIQRAQDRKKFADFSKIKLDTKENKAKLSKKLVPAKKLYGANNVTAAELFITEGDSASGNLIQCRLNGKNGYYQAVMPVRGKVINSFKATPEKVMGNEEAVTILNAIGAGIGSNYNEEKLNYNHVIIATDTDSDGDNISSLITTLIFSYMPDLIKNGHLYRAIAPLYANTMKNKKVINTYSQQEQEALLNSGQEIVKVARYKGLGELNVPLTRETLVNPETRRIFQFTTEDFDQAYETQQMLMGTKVEARREFLMENGDFANIEE